MRTQSAAPRHRLEAPAARGETGEEEHAERGDRDQRQGVGARLAEVGRIPVQLAPDPRREHPDAAGNAEQRRRLERLERPHGDDEHARVQRGADERQAHATHDGRETCPARQRRLLERRVDRRERGRHEQEHDRHEMEALDQHHPAEAEDVDRAGAATARAHDSTSPVRGLARKIHEIV